MLVAKENALVPGLELDFTTINPGPNGDTSTIHHDRVEAVAGSGFRGPVAILGSSVLKTGVFPDDTSGRFKDTLALLNWDTAHFPPAASEQYARHDAVVGSVIGIVCSAMTDGEVYVPESFGYVDLGPQIGFAQHIEKVEGKIPTFLDNGSEVNRLRDERRRIWDIGVEFGIESVSQVHPLNPLGGGNLWLPPDGNLAEPTIWFDYLARFPLKGRVLPNPKKYKFHKDAQRAFGVQAPFDKIHVEKFMEALERNREKFSDQDYTTLLAYLDMYPDIRTEYDEIYRAKFIAQNVGVLAGKSVKKAVQLIPDSVRFTKKIITDAEQRKEFVVDSMILGGFKEAVEHGLVSPNELAAAKTEILEEDRIRMLVNLGAFFATSSIAWNTATVIIGATQIFVLHAELETIAKTATFFNIAPGVLRGLVTASTGIKNRENLSVMAALSVFPTFGTPASVFYQVSKESGHLDPRVKHYALRSALGRLSSALMQGGVDSDFVQKNWQRGYRSKVKMFAAKRALGKVASFVPAVV